MNHTIMGIALEGNYKKALNHPGMKECFFVI